MSGKSSLQNKLYHQYKARARTKAVPSAESEAENRFYEVRTSELEGLTHRLYCLYEEQAAAASVPL